MLLLALVLAMPNQAELNKRAAKFAPTEITAPADALPPEERAALKKIVDAAPLMDAIYLRQAWAGNPQLLFQLSQDHSPLGQARLRLFTINKGPWSNIDQDESFIPGVPERPKS